MSSAHQADNDTSQKVATLRELLKRPISRHRIAPLVTLLIARDVDIHEKMLTDLGNRVQQMKGSLHNESKHASRVLERMHDIEEDAKALRRLIQDDEQKNTEARTDQEQLKVTLAEAVKQNSTDMAGIGEHLKTIKDLVEAQQKKTKSVEGVLDAMGRGMESLQHDINGLKQCFGNIPSTSPIAQYMAELEERIKSFDSISRSAENVRLSLESTKAQPDPRENPPGARVVDGTMNPSVGDCHARGSFSTGQENPTRRQPTLRDWPAIVDFLAVYEQFKGIFKSKKPRNEPHFIAEFLEKINTHVSCALQRHLLEIYPNRVALSAPEAGRQPPKIFIKLGKMKWKYIRYAIPRFKDLRVLQWALNESISGPPQSMVSDQCGGKLTGERASVDKNLLAPSNCLAKDDGAIVE